MGARALVALPREGSAVEVEIEPLPDRPDLLPLRVTIEADGVVVARSALRRERVAGARDDRVRLPGAPEPDRPSTCVSSQSLP